MKRTGVIIILILALLGLADSVYLAQHAASGTPLLCDIQGLSDCNIVATSAYSRIFGIPVADLGVFFYSVLFVLAALEVLLFDRILRRVLQVFSIIGLLMSLYSVAVQIFAIKAYCVYCLASALITLVVFVLATRIEPLKKSEKVNPPSTPPESLAMPPSA